MNSKYAPGGAYLLLTGGPVKTEINFPTLYKEVR